MSNTIALITDFGEKDGYVGTIKGVINSIAPSSQIIDMSHQVERHNIKEASWILNFTHKYFRQNTIFLVIVDPSVGSLRQPIAIKTDKHYFIGPDNGVLSHILQKEIIKESVVLTNDTFWLSEYSSTFHGRDIFAPVAAHLAIGNNSLNSFGEPKHYESFVNIDYGISSLKGNKILGEIIYIDNFGNIITNIASYYIKNDNIQVNIHGETIHGLKTAYSDVEVNESVTLIGSHNYLEIAINFGNAAKKFRAQVGEAVSVQVN